MLEVLDRKVIGVGENKRTQHVILPIGWCRLKELKPGDNIKMVVTDNAVMVFVDAGVCEEFVKTLSGK